MILADTSVWIDHFRGADKQLVPLLLNDEVCCHPFVIGELACGNLQNRDEVLGLLADLPQISVADHNEVLGLIRVRGLYGKGLGWVDVHLLTSALLGDARLLTSDRALARVAELIGVSA